MTRKMMLSIVRRINTTDATLRRYLHKIDHDDTEFMLAIVDHYNVSQDTLMEVYFSSPEPEVIAAIASQVTTEKLAARIVEALSDNLAGWSEDDWYEIHSALSCNSSVRYFDCMMGFARMSYPRENWDDGYGDSYDYDYDYDDKEDDDEDDKFWGQAWDDAMEK